MFWYQLLIFTVQPMYVPPLTFRGLWLGLSSSHAALCDLRTSHTP